MPVKGYNFPSQTYANVKEAIRLNGGTSAVDWELAEAADILYARTDSHISQLSTLDGKVTEILSRLAQLESRVRYEQLGDGSPFKGTDAPQKIPHGLGVVPKFVLVVPIDGDGKFDCTDSDTSTVTVEVTRDNRYRVYVFR